MADAFEEVKVDCRAAKQARMYEHSDDKQVRRRRCARELDADGATWPPEPHSDVFVKLNVPRRAK